MRRIIAATIVSFGLLLVFAQMRPAIAANDEQAPGVEKSGKKIAALIVDGQNNHDWKHTTPVLKAALESCGLFTVDVATSPARQASADFKPDFAKYGVVISNYNGDDWSAGDQEGVRGLCRRRRRFCQRSCGRQFVSRIGRNTTR